MTTDGAFGLDGLVHGDALPGAFLSRGAVAATTMQTLGPWLLARVADGGREAVFTFETDERYARVRRVHGATASMMECRLSPAMTAAELAQAVARWAPSQSMAARVQTVAGGPRVTLALPTD